MSDLVFCVGSIVKPAEPCDGCQGVKFRLGTLTITVGERPDLEEQEATWLCVECHKPFVIVNREEERHWDKVENRRIQGQHARRSALGIEP